MGFRSLAGGGLLSFLLFLSSAYCQQSPQGPETVSLEDALRRLPRDAAIPYVTPVVSGLGADLNSAWFHRAPAARFLGFDLEFGIVAMGTFYEDTHRTFSSKTFFQFDSLEAATLTGFIKNGPGFTGYSQQQRDALQRTMIDSVRRSNLPVGIAGATAVGSEKDTVNVTFSGGSFRIHNPVSNQDTSITIPAAMLALGFGGAGKLSDIQGLPLAAPQLTIGTIAGSQLTVRYLPNTNMEGIGTIEYFGYGIQHNPSVWFGGVLPVEISASFFTQTLKAGSLFNAKATSFGINASKRFGWSFLNVTPYAGYMVETSSITVSYDYTVNASTGPKTQHMEFDLAGENKNRITLGLSIKLLIVNLNADYNIGKYRTASIGLMFII